MGNPKKSEIDIDKITMSHRMADGTIRDSVEDYNIPLNEHTAIMYDLIIGKTHVGEKIN